MSARPKGIDVTFTHKLKGDYSYIRTDDERWLKRNDPVIAVSKFIQDKYGGEVIGNGCHERFSDIGLDRDIDVLIEGNFEPNKNIEATIKEAKKHGKKIVWFGRHTKDLGVEHYSNPSLKDIVILYNRSKKFLKMSLNEGWCRPIAEAKRCGCEVINLNGGNREVEIVSWDSVAVKLLKYLDGQLDR